MTMRENAARLALAVAALTGAAGCEQGSRPLESANFPRAGAQELPSVQRNVTEAPGTSNIPEVPRDRRYADLVKHHPPSFSETEILAFEKVVEGIENTPAYQMKKEREAGTTVDTISFEYGGTKVILVDSHGSRTIEIVNEEGDPTLRLIGTPMERVYRIANEKVLAYQRESDTRAWRALTELDARTIDASQWRAESDSGSRTVVGRQGDYNFAITATYRGKAFDNPIVDYAAEVQHVDENSSRTYNSLVAGWRETELHEAFRAVITALEVSGPEGGIVVP